MKIKWTKQIPTKVGRYLTKSITTDFVCFSYISKKDLQIQDNDSSYLVGVYYSERIEDEDYGEK